jgi:hypothetical protein
VISPFQIKPDRDRYVVVDDRWDKKEPQHVRAIARSQEDANLIAAAFAEQLKNRHNSILSGIKRRYYG